MSSTPYQKEGYPLISKKELKCIWMTAGLITYKLCKYDLQCEKCPLDWELRNLSSGPSYSPPPSSDPEGENADGKRPAWPSGREPQEAGDPLPFFPIKESLFYHPGHTWVKVEKADELRVGIDSFLGGIAGEPKVVLLPLPNTRGSQGEKLCSLILEDGILNLVFPMSGSILSVNSRLQDHPELLHQDPLGEGYLLTLKPKNLQRELKHLMSGEEAYAWHRKEWERFKEVLLSELPQTSKALGWTLQDGGIRLREVRRSLGGERYIHLVNAFLRGGEERAFPWRHRSHHHSKSHPG